ncbi:MAG: hypothetical protein JSW28_01460, partial [Thermoplasmata archaeon]
RPGAASALGGGTLKGKFEPKIIGYLCNWCRSAFFFGPKFFAGSGSQRKTWGKKKLALTCSNFVVAYKQEVDS